jgi:hypothetical protein
MVKPNPQDPRTDTELEEDVDPMPNTFEARYFGSCANCPEKIAPKQEVVWVGEDFLGGVYAHAVCPDSEPDLAAPKGVCPACFLAIPVSGVCGNC